MPLLQRRRRPFDPIDLRNIIGFSGESLGEQLKRLRPTIPLGGPSISGQESIVPVSALPVGLPDENSDENSNQPGRQRPAIVPPIVQPSEQVRWLQPQAESVTPMGDMQPSVRPAIVPPVDMATPTLATIGEPPPVPTFDPIIRDSSGGRPRISPTAQGDPENILSRERDALVAFQPQKESKKHLALRALLSLPLGGLPAVANTLVGQGGAFDRRGIDRAWQQGELAKAQATLGDYRDQRRQGLQDRVLAAQVQRIENPQDEPPKYDWLPNPADPQGSDVYAPLKPGAVRPVRTKSERPREFNLSPGQQRFEIGPDGKPRLVAQVPDREKPQAGTETPQQVAIRQRQFRAAKKTLDDLSSQEQSAAAKKDAAYARASTLRDWRAKGIAGESGMIPSADEIKAADEAAAKAQAAYESYAKEKTKALADMTQYGDVDEKGEPREPVATQQTPVVFKPARDGKYHYTPDQIKAALKPGQTYEHVLQQLKARPNVVIDQ